MFMIPTASMATKFMENKSVAPIYNNLILTNNISGILM